MKTLLITWLLLSLGLSRISAQSPPKNDDGLYYWKILSRVSVKSSFDDERGEVIYKPVFSKAVKSLEGKKIYLKGYIIPAEMTNGQMTLSAVPYTACFFCGGAGPETVIEINATEPIIYRMGKPIVIEGILKLNRDDHLSLFYKLDAAKYRHMENLTKKF